MMRMHPDRPSRLPADERRVRNSLNMSTSRVVNEQYRILSWYARGMKGVSERTTKDIPRECMSDHWLMQENKVQEENKAFLNEQEALGHQCLSRNSTRGLVPGLIDPSLPDVPTNRIRQPKEALRLPRRKIGGRGQQPANNKSSKRKRDNDDEEGEGAAPDTHQSKRPKTAVTDAFEVSTVSDSRSGVIIADRKIRERSRQINPKPGWRQRSSLINPKLNQIKPLLNLARAANVFVRMKMTT